MDAPAATPAASKRVLLALAASALAAAASLAESSASLPAPGAPLPALSFFVDRKLGAGLQESLEEAAHRLSDSRCQEVLTDFADARGHRLDENLRATGRGLPSYLGLVLFYDGSATEACASERVLAWTNPGSRAVHVCWNRFAYWQRANPGYAANIVIHETLHTLGLGESPPAPAAITAKVTERCGR